MAVMTYTAYTDVVGAKGLLSTIRTFALSVGWTVDYYQTTAAWGGVSAPYGWIAGTRDFLGLYSTGYGGQQMVYRLEAYPQSGGLHDWFYIVGIKSASRALDTTSAQVPTTKSTQIWTSLPTTYMYFSAPPSTTTIPFVHCFGNARQIWVCAQWSSSPGACCTFGFGLPDLYPEYQATNDAFMTSLPAYSTIVRWDQYLTDANRAYIFWGGALASTGVAGLYWEGEARFHGPSPQGYAHTLTFSSADIPAEAGSFCRPAYRARGAQYANKRLLVKPIIIAKDFTGSGEWVPIGTEPYYWLKTEDLAWGELIEEDAKQFRCYPIRVVGSWIGGAFQVA